MTNLQLPLLYNDVPSAGSIKYDTCWQFATLVECATVGFGFYLIIAGPGLLEWDKILIGLGVCFRILILFQEFCWSKGNCVNFRSFINFILSVAGLANITYICIRTASFTTNTDMGVIYAVAFYCSWFVPCNIQLFRNINEFVCAVTDVNSLDALIRLCIAHKKPDGCLVAGLIVQILSAWSHHGVMYKANEAKMR